MFGGDQSFPSGHATQAFAVASVIAESYDPMWVKLGSYGVASMVGYARMERNAHWASDVLAGALIGTFVGKTVVQFNKNRRFEITPIVDGDTVGAKVTHTF
jgi:membrane-associated phospholipid phosphatase